MSKLWQKNYNVNGLIEQFTVADDYILDLRLIGADCAASIAHARMLHKLGYLTQEELNSLETSLQEIFEKFQQNTISISLEQEDCHTMIEDYLVAKLNETGRRIHLGRSRNDQSITAIRLYAREYTLEILSELIYCMQTIAEFARLHEKAPMPGRTHLQIAMPSSVGFWAAAFAEELLDIIQILHTTFEIYNRSPLGTAAGYGTPMYLDREFTAKLLAFPSLQHNALAVQNSRGRIDAALCDSFDQVAIVISKIAQDLILFTLPEFRYFSLADEFLTGSSIMPQKKNPDLLELIRSRSANILSFSFQIKSIVRSLPSGYNRDLQDTKEPFYNSLDTVYSIIQIITLVFKNLRVDEKKLRDAHSADIYATDKAIELVQTGLAFRTAYKQVGESLEGLREFPIDAALEKRDSLGHPANLALDNIFHAIANWNSAINLQKSSHLQAMQNLVKSPAGIIKLPLKL